MTTQDAIVAGLVDFAWIFIPILLLTLALYFGLAFAILWLNKRHPERRIQKGRYGEKRMWPEIRTSMGSIAVTCFSLAGGLFAQQQGWTIAPLELNWWTAIPMFVLCVVLFDAWFYWMHRLMHVKGLYRWHQWHHRSVAPTVWSTFSDDPLDTLVMQGFYLVAPFIIPFPPAVLVVHRIVDHFNGTIGHCGFEYFASRGSRWPSPAVCTIFHDQHHSAFRYNFANYFSFWDRLCGTMHPGYDEEVKRFENPSKLVTD